MPKSRGRKPKKPRRLSIDQPQSLPAQQQTNRLPLAKRISEHPAFLWIVIVSTLVGVASLALYEIREPSISFEGEADVSSPLASPFTVTNRSSLFAMHSPAFICRVASLKSASGAGMDNVYIEDPSTANVEADSTVSFLCKTGTGANGTREFVKFPDSVISAHIFVRLEYQTLRFRRTSPETEFTWFTKANPPRWIKGKLAD